MHCIPLATAAVFMLATAVPFALQQTTSPPKSAHSTFMLVGCLEAPIDQTSPFKLTGAVPVGQAPPSHRPRASAGDGKGGVSYDLQPTSGVNQQGLDAAALKRHVGQRVQVTVRPIDTVAAPPSSQTSATREAVTPEPAPERFSVTAVDIVSGPCR